MLKTPQKLWCSVPHGHNFIGEYIFESNFPAEAKICQFDFSIIIEQDISGFDISMEYLIPVEVGDSLDELFEDAFDLWQCELASHFEESCEVVVHILEDEEGGPALKVAFVGSGEYDLLELDNIRMIYLLQQSNL